MSKFKIDRFVPQFSCKGEFEYAVFKEVNGVFGMKRWKWEQRFGSVRECLSFIDAYQEFPIYVSKSAT